MRKRFLFFILSLIIPALAICQQPVILIKGSGNTLYLEHTVTPRENFYSVGRLFNVSPRDLASYNGISMDHGLNIGQVLKIPLDKNNFSQSTSKSAAEALVPLYHKVLSNETLFRIGANYKNLPVATLKKWNHLSSDQVTEGKPLVVGYLRVNKSESALANAKFDVPEKKSKEIVPADITPTAKTQVVTKTEEPKKDAAPNTVTETAPPVISPVNSSSNTSASGSANEGFFKQEFQKKSADNNLQSVNGAASVFKSTSGWQDKKYYCFNNDATPGSIVRITSPGSSKFVYAKVLDAIPDIKQNEGVQLVLSNAAADALGVTGDKFDAVISFVK